MEARNIARLKSSMALFWGVGCSLASADVSLTAAQAPVDPPWEQPASLSVIREKGKNSVSADAVLLYRSVARVRSKGGTGTSDTDSAWSTNWSAGGYVHRNNDDKSPQNDRGVSASYSLMLVPPGSPTGPTVRLDAFGKVKFGKSLSEVDVGQAVPIFVDRQKDRQLLGIGGTYWAVPKVSPKEQHNQFQWFAEGSITLYSDNVRGGEAVGRGRVTGTQAAFAINVAPFGLAPDRNTWGKFGMVPTIRISAQSQEDATASGDRKKGHRQLYVAALNLAFAPVRDYEGVVPSLQLSRTVGADLLQGLGKTARTELVLGFTF